MERTLAIIKPDAVQRQLVGVIISEIEMNKFAIAAIRTLRLTVEQAALFYEEHRAKPFYDSLVAYMSSGQLFRPGPGKGGRHRRVAAADGADRSRPGRDR